MEARWGPYTAMKELQDEPPVIIDHAEGVYVYDEAGRRYLDAHAGLWLVNVGYHRQEIIDAMHHQAERLAWFSSFGGMANRPSLTLAQRMVERFSQDGMATVFFSNDGSEAVETALKMARQYWRAMGKSQRIKYLSRQHSYHGVTMGALSVAGITGNRVAFEPLLSDVRHGPAPYAAHCPFHGADMGCNYHCVSELERIIQFEGPETIAAFIAEPVQAAGGVIIPPPGYWERVAELCRRYDILLIADEVVTGFGRLGAWSGSRYYGFQPDMMTFAKGITSGYMPLGATMVSSKIYKGIVEHGSGANPEFRHGNTYSGHPVAAAAALANLDILERDHLIEQVKPKSDVLAQGLTHLVQESLGWCRNAGVVGLLGRIEVGPPDGIAGSPPGTYGSLVNRLMRERGVIVRVAGDVVTLSPPLIITDEQITVIMDALSDSVHALQTGNRAL